MSGDEVTEVDEARRAYLDTASVLVDRIEELGMIAEAGRLRDRAGHRAGIAGGFCYILWSNDSGIAWSLRRDPIALVLMRAMADLCARWINVVAVDGLSSCRSLLERAMDEENDECRRKKV